MLDHSGITVSDLTASRAFYSAALAPLGYVILKQLDDSFGFGAPAGYGRSLDPHGDFWIILGAVMMPRPHFAFSAASRQLVDAFFAAAIRAGGTDNGGPGERPQYHPDYYAAFVLDPDGYNIEAVCHLPA